MILLVTNLFLKANPDQMHLFFERDLLLLFSPLNKLPHTLVGRLLTTFASSTSPLLLPFLSSHLPLLTNALRSSSSPHTSPFITEIVLTLSQSNPSTFLALLSNSEQRLLRIAVDCLYETATVFSDESKGRCLSFGKETERLRVLLTVLSKGGHSEQDRIDETKFDLLALLELVVLCTATADDALSDEAVSCLSSHSDLTLVQTRTLLFATQPTLRHTCMFSENAKRDWEYMLDSYDVKLSCPPRFLSSLHFFLSYFETEGN
ncbi:hypothetical protein BLNAU_22453 [Blattamonas nauphoetae]|uniref:Uncharacterized protein n=1 Tax=Blattamonas nauphoetae TaxID=2049346 RepID=A0ABQ9WT01_9EUKA|nr:hypothetical protein BLNAU_22453 [Blattamonas nauphoetae]